MNRQTTHLSSNTITASILTITLQSANNFFTVESVIKNTIKYHYNLLALTTDDPDIQVDQNTSVKINDNGLGFIFLLTFSISFYFSFSFIFYI